MKTIAKQSAGNVVEFLATSPRLAHAYRYAEKHNKSLARLSGMHDLGHTSIEERLAVPNRLKRRTGVVVLSHAEEEMGQSRSARLGTMLPEAFFLLFTEPTTHPDQIRQWVRRVRVRGDNRLHLVKVDALETLDVSHLLGRVCTALAGNDHRNSIIDAYASGDTLVVRGPKHRLLRVPFDAIPSLRNASRAVQRSFEIDPDGSFLHWPKPDIHLGWSQLLQAADPHEYRKAQQRSEGFNRRYGTAIRKLREEAALTQSKIPGLTERQVRRIEQGESRATSNALAFLAAAHHLDTNAYLEKLAKAMK